MPLPEVSPKKPINRSCGPVVVTLGLEALLVELDAAWPAVASSTLLLEFPEYSKYRPPIALQDEAALKLGVMFFFEYIEIGALNISAV